MGAPNKRLALAILLVLGIGYLAANGSLAGDKRVPLRVGFHVDKTRLNKDFAEKDVTLATKMLFGKVLEQSGEFTPSFHPFNKESDYIEAIKAGELDYVEIGPLLWFRLPEETRRSIRPLSVIQMGEKRLEHFVLLAAPGSSLTSLAGKRLRVHSGPDRGIANLWIEHELRSSGLGVLLEHFGEVETHHKSDSVLLPTFFGKADACLVREEDYAVAAELNPQIAQRLVAVRTSPGFPFIMTAAAGANSKMIRERLSGERAEKILNQSGGQQAFALLRIKKLCAYQEGDLDALGKLVKAADDAAQITSTTKPDAE